MLDTTLFKDRDLDRFYDYPPLLPETDNLDIWEKKKLGIYVHIPFCLKFCDYCPYNKYIYNKKLAIQYVDALIKDIQETNKKGILKSYHVDVIFIGGGTPTCLETDQLVRIINTIKSVFTISKDVQITVESNPKTSKGEEIESLKKAGLNRISFGVQSFNDNMLRSLGRLHTGQNAIVAINKVKEIGINHINVDLMYRLPNQNISQWVLDLDTAIELGCDHISAFALNIKPKTKFYSKYQNKSYEDYKDWDKETLFIAKLNEKLTNHGYGQYTIDSWAKQGCESKYNTYSKEILAFGAGSHSHFNGYEFCKEYDPKQYIMKIDDNKSPIVLGKKLDSREEMERYIVIGILHLSINLKEYYKKFGVTVDQLYPKVNALIEDGMLEKIGDCLKVTEKGKYYIFNISKFFFGDRYKNVLFALRTFKEA